VRPSRLRQHLDRPPREKLVLEAVRDVGIAPPDEDAEVRLKRGSWP
jgi:hypothetical protein